MGQPSQRLLDVTEEVWRVELSKDEQFSLLWRIQCTYSFFRNLSKRSFACRERVTLQACYPLWSTIRLSPIEPLKSSPVLREYL